MDVNPHKCAHPEGCTMLALHHYRWKSWGVARFSSRCPIHQLTTAMFSGDAGFTELNLQEFMVAQVLEV